MTESKRDALAAAIVLLAIAAALGWQAYLTPAGPFDPIGSGAVPLVVAIVMGGLALAMTVVELRRPDDGRERARPSSGAWARPAAFCAATLAFAGAFVTALAPLPVLLGGYLIGAGLALQPLPVSRGRLAAIGVSALGIALAITWVFTHVLYVDFD